MGKLFEKTDALSLFLSLFSSDVRSKLTKTLGLNDAGVQRFLNTQHIRTSTKRADAVICIVLHKGSVELLK